MRHPTLITWKGCLHAILLGVLFGWLLIAMRNPTHHRSTFDLSSVESSSVHSCHESVWPTRTLASHIGTQLS
ncbi:MAG: hypothetical protein WAT84_00635 [Candidatus Moraniibacteriota bacterium]